MTTAKTHMMFRVKGTTDDVTTCDQCGREDLKGTIVLAYLDSEGAEGSDVTYMGSDCGAHATGWTQGEIRKAARTADQVKRAFDERARQEQHDKDNAAFMKWVEEIYGVTGAAQPADLHGRVPGMTPFKIRKAYQRATGRH